MRTPASALAPAFTPILAMAGAILLGLSACSLEHALGVDEGESAMGSGSSGEPGGGPGGSGGTGEGEGEGSTTGDASDEDSTGPALPPTECAGRTLRVATFNVQGIGGSQTTDFQALADVLGRVDADVVCLQEVADYETSQLQALAASAGYPRVIQANESPAIGGSHTNACLSRELMTLEGSYSGADLSDDPTANDVGRDILVVRVDLSTEAASCGLGVVALHLKSGQDELDWFRRQVEAERVAQAVARYRVAHPDEPMVILGDLNENLDDPALGHVFDQIPAGLPSSYHLGTDISMPLVYQPFEMLGALGFTPANATQEDSTYADETWADLVRLDYVLYAGAEGLDDEVYNACRDNGVDDAPEGNWVPKAGSPLPCATSEQASDHFPVLVDLRLP